MIIDLHCHTKNAKKGDALREVDVETFSKTISDHGVKIVAITNHNLFDIEQFENFSTSLEGKAFIWPGIELDVIGDKSSEKCFGHVIVICDPKKKMEFSETIKRICNVDPNEFKISIEDLSTSFSNLGGCVFICHYHKYPELSKEDIDFLKNTVSEDNLVLLEPSNSRKAGLVVYDDEFGCWFGSDVTDWAHYPNANPEFSLPDCLFNLSSFDSFKTLLSKDKSAVLLNSLMSPKRIDCVEILPFDDLNLKIPLFKHVNVIFGGKATGKTVILHKFEEFFIQKNKTVRSYYIESKQEDLKKLVQTSIKSDEMLIYEQHSCKNEIETIKKWSWKEIPTLHDFYAYEEYLQKSSTAQRLKITSASFSDVVNETEFKEDASKKQLILKQINEFNRINTKEYLSNDEKTTFSLLINKVFLGYENELLNILYSHFGKKLEKWSIEYLTTKFASANSIPKKPINVGFVDTYCSFKDLEKSVFEISKNMSFSIDTKKELIGVLPLKGNVYRKIYSGFLKQKNPKKESYEITGGERKIINSNFTIKNISDFSDALNDINLLGNSEDISQKIDILKKIIADTTMKSLIDFLNYTIFLQTDCKDDFKPSNGVTSILLVDSAVRDTKCDVIILDEPDGGMGADFVNKTLIPEIFKRASEDKIIIIGTHDPNLVVRTHPYCCIYRDEPISDEYETYIGCSFEDYLISIKDDKKKISWVDACVEKCEGGENALLERERTYGKR